MIENEGYTALKKGFLGNCHYPMLKFHKDYPEYDYCWLIEDDVVFSGHWSTFFDAFLDDTSDLLSTKVRNFRQDHFWNWWFSLKPPAGVIKSVDQLYASFNPIYRLSARALEVLDEEMKNGWEGHFEAVVPTALFNRDLKLHDIKQKGFYSEKTHHWKPLDIQLIKSNMIYHPIKEKISKKTYKKNCLVSVVTEKTTNKFSEVDESKRDYDIHLIVSDMSFGKRYKDGDFVYNKSGASAELIKDYFYNHKYLLDAYDYFFIIDDDASMNNAQINEVFREMNETKCEFSMVGLINPCYCSNMFKKILSEGVSDSTIYFD